MNTTSSTADESRLPSDVIALHRERDVLVLCRRARRLVQLSGATLSASVLGGLLEVGHLVCAVIPGARVDLTVAPGVALEARFSAAHPHPSTAAAQLDASFATLSPRVQHLEVLVWDGRVLLTAAFAPADSTADAGTPDPISGGVDAGDRPGADTVEQLQAVSGRLQRDLQQSNQSLNALFAALDDDAACARAEEEQLRALEAGAEDYATCMLDPSGFVTSWTSSAARLFGYAGDEIIGRSFSAFFLPEDRDNGLPEARLLGTAEHGRLTFEGRWSRADGRAFDAQVILATVRDDTGAARGHSLLVRNVSERVRPEQELRRRSGDVVSAARVKEDFLATLSHELRTPLNAMLGWTRLLRLGTLDTAATARALETIERNASLQEQLISDLLDVSLMGAGRWRLDFQTTDLTALFEDTLRQFDAVAAAKNVVLRWSVVDPSVVLGDSQRLRQVIANLVANAVKFTPPGGAVTASLHRRGAHAIITVSDTGEGIAADLLPFVFDRFRQGDASVTRQHGGLGVGLTIVRHIVELHGGRIEARSAGGGAGAMFSVTVPINRAPRTQDAGLTDTRLLSGLRVLVVDDEPDARNVVSQALADCGASATAVGSTMEALQILDEMQPDVLVSDINMPGEDGCALIRRVRALGAGRGAELPAVAFTALAGPEDRRRALRAGFQGFVLKPARIDELAATIRRVSGRV